jgi:integrase
MAWLYRRKDSRRWWVGWRVGQKSYFQSTGTADKAEAQKELAKVRAMFEARRAGSLTQEVFESLTGRTIPKKSLVSELDDWIAECERTTSHETVERYRTIAEAFKEFSGATERGPLLYDVTSEHVRTFLSQRREKRGATTVNLERKILTVFFRRAVEGNRLKVSPLLGVKAEKVSRREKRQRRAFTVAELRDIYAKAEALGDFWKFLVLAGTYTGQRMGDLVCLTWGALDFQANTLTLYQRKTDRRVIMPLRPALRALLWQLRERMGKAGTRENDSIWPEEAAAYTERGAGQFSNQFYDRILVPCGIMPARTHKRTKAGRDTKRDASPASFHSLRHTFVSLLKIAGSAQATVKELAGHASDEISDHYTHLPVEVLADSIKKLPEVTK